VTDTLPQMAAAIHITVVRSEIRSAMGPGLGEILKTVKAQGIGPSGPWFTHQFEADPTTYDLDICVPVSAWHRNRHYPVAAQIRELLPRFLKMPDPEILAASFMLSDAQEMVARQQGFDSWQALKTGLPITSRKVKSPPSKAIITAAEPQLFVADIKKSCE
jgi:hypothetical protein